MTISITDAAYRWFLLVIALIHIVILPLAILLLGTYFTSRLTGRIGGGRTGFSLLWVAFATAIAGVPALVVAFSLHPNIAVIEISPFYLVMIFGGAIAARLPGLISGLRLRKLPFHGILSSLMAATGDILSWACLDLLLISGFAVGYVWLFAFIGLPAFLGRIAAHNFNAMAQLGSRQALAAPKTGVIVPSLPAVPDN